MSTEVILIIFHDLYKSNHYAVYLKLVQWCMSINISIKLEEKKNPLIKVIIKSLNKSKKSTFLNFYS